LVLPEAVKHWSLTTLRERPVKIGAKVVRHSRSVIFQMAEVAVPRALFRTILGAIAALRPLAPARCLGSPPRVVSAAIGGRGVPRPEAVDRNKRHLGWCCTAKEELRRPRSRNLLSKGLGEDYRLFRRRKIKGYLGNPG
jgi:hypothetical protein